MRFRWGLAIVALGVGAIGAAHGQGATWKAGVAKAIVTPTHRGLG
jgi:hypothetical protein